MLPPWPNEIVLMQGWGGGRERERERERNNYRVFQKSPLKLLLHP